jgi:hypothetical protein
MTAQVIQRSSLAEVERFLLALGGGNHSDNMSVLWRFRCFYLLRLSREDFFDLVFLQSKAVGEIAPQSEDRRLKAVADRALTLGDKIVGPNWDLSAIRGKFRALTMATSNYGLPALVLRDAQDAERAHGGSWYIQDGNHRALAYAMAILDGTIQYSPQLAYLATQNLHGEPAPDVIHR